MSARCDYCRETPTTWSDDGPCAFVHNTILELEALPTSEVAEREGVKERLAHEYMALLAHGSGG